MSEVALAMPLAGEELSAGLIEEYAWVERAREGDIDAFDLIMGRYEQRLQRFLIGLVGDVDIAQELCQETFFSAYRALPRLRGDLKLSAWLHTIALNQARSHHRRRKVRPQVPLGDYDRPESGPELQDSVALSDLVQRVLARLPRQYSEPLLMQVSSGLSCREIGDILGTSEGAIKVRLLRAREAFRKAYDKEGGA
jgi:RNA polymerase sigma-70 factor, ECF subfamily